ncbi:MAG: L,D-transpeptidase [Pseudomonadota bacterium]
MRQELMNRSAQSRTPSIARVIGVAVIAAAPFILSACTSTTATSSYGAPNIDRDRLLGVDPGTIARNRAASRRAQAYSFNYDAIYASRLDNDVSVTAFDYSKMNKRYLRQVVRFYGPEAPGTIVVDATAPFLYLVLDGGMAMRYGIAVGKEGFGWVGNAKLQWKQAWPTWTPPSEMIARKPSLAKYKEGMQGGPQNPLGARAMYLFKNGKDTMYRIHGTNKPFSIGKKASSGCFRMINQDVIDLYSRVKNGAQVLVRPNVTSADTETI